MARLYRQQGSKRTIWFCSFDGEERNLMGSSEFLRTISESGELDHVVAYFGIDQAAYGDNFWILTSSDEPHLSPKSNMAELARNVILSMKLDRLETTLRGPEPLHAASDHWPFFYSGVPSILIGWHPFEEYHRGGDIFEKCIHDEKFLLTAHTADNLLQSILTQPQKEIKNRPLNAGFVVQPPAIPNK
jgi:Zn-dependent M28 family amino/carboxypeptidase